MRESRQRSECEWSQSVTDKGVRRAEKTDWALCRNYADSALLPRLSTQAFSFFLFDFLVSTVRPSQPSIGLCRPGTLNSPYGIVMTTFAPRQYPIVPPLPVLWSDSIYRNRILLYYTTCFTQGLNPMFKLNARCSRLNACEMFCLAKCYMLAVRISIDNNLTSVKVQYLHKSPGSVNFIVVLLAFKRLLTNRLHYFIA